MSTKKETKRDVILDAAFHLFLEKGYLNTKIIDIAAAAGIGKGTVYEYFDSKESLLLEILNGRIVESFKHMYDSILSLPTAKERLKAYLDFQREATRRYKTNVFDLRQEILRVEDSSTREVLRTIHSVIMYQFDTVRQIVEEGIAAGELRPVNPAMAAGGILSVINSFVVFKYAGIMASCEAETMRAQMLGGTEDWSEEDFLDMVFYGLAAESQAGHETPGEAK